MRSPSRNGPRSARSWPTDARPSSSARAGSARGLADSAPTTRPSGSIPRTCTRRSKVCATASWTGPVIPAPLPTRAIACQSGRSPWSSSSGTSTPKRSCLPSRPFTSGRSRPCANGSLTGSPASGCWACACFARTSPGRLPRPRNSSAARAGCSLTLLSPPRCSGPHWITAPGRNRSAACARRSVPAPLQSPVARRHEPDARRASRPAQTTTSPAEIPHDPSHTGPGNQGLSRDGALLADLGPRVRGHGRLSVHGGAARYMAAISACGYDLALASAISLTMAIASAI